MAKDKIILIHTGNFCEGKPEADLAIPSGVVYLGSYLASRGYKVTLMDARLKERSLFFEALQKELPDAALAGLSVMTPLVKEALETSRFIKKADPSVSILWGGFHPTLFPESTIRNEYIDFIISGEGEKGILALVEHLLGKRELATVENLTYKVKGAILKTAVAGVEDLQAIGIPSYDLFDLSPYLGQQAVTQKRKLDILTSRGCHARCTFCVNSIIHKSRWRAEPLQQTLRHIDSVIERYRVGEIVFIDEDFFCDLGRIKELVPELARRGLCWGANCRADYIRDDYMDDGLLRKLREAGCVELRFGFESGSQRILHLLNKGLTVKQSLNAVKKVSRSGIGISASFMMAIPDETPDDILKTLDLILKIYRINPKTIIIGPSVFRPYPGSVLFERCAQKGLVVPSSLDEWSNFYMLDNPAYNSKNCPWFAQTGFLRRVNLCTMYLHKPYFPRWLVYAVIKFHIMTRCRFIYVDYFVFKCAKRLFGYLFGLSVIIKRTLTL